MCAERKTNLTLLSHLPTHLWFGYDVLKRQQGRVLGPSEGAHVVAHLRSLGLGQAEHEQALHEAFSACHQRQVTNAERLRLDTPLASTIVVGRGKKT